MTNWFTRIHHRFISQLMSQGVWKNSTPKSTPMMLRCYPCTVSIAHCILSKTVLWKNLRFEDDMIEEYYWHCPIYIGYGIDINKIWYDLSKWLSGVEYMLIYHRYLILLIFFGNEKIYNSYLYHNKIQVGGHFFVLWGQSHQLFFHLKLSKEIFLWSSTSSSRSSNILANKNFNQNSILSL